MHAKEDLTLACFLVCCVFNLITLWCVLYTCDIACVRSTEAVAGTRRPLIGNDQSRIPKVISMIATTAFYFASVLFVIALAMFAFNSGHGRREFVTAVVYSGGNLFIIGFFALFLTQLAHVWFTFHGNAPIFGCNLPYLLYFELFTATIAGVAMFWSEYIMFTETQIGAIAPYRVCDFAAATAITLAIVKQLFLLFLFNRRLFQLVRLRSHTIVEYEPTGVSGVRQSVSDDWQASLDIQQWALIELIQRYSILNLCQIIIAVVVTATAVVGGIAPDSTAFSDPYLLFMDRNYIVWVTLMIYSLGCDMECCIQLLFFDKAAYFVGCRWVHHCCYRCCHYIAVTQYHRPKRKIIAVHRPSKPSHNAYAPPNESTDLLVNLQQSPSPLTTVAVAPPKRSIL